MEISHASLSLVARNRYARVSDAEKVPHCLAIQRDTVHENKTRAGVARALAGIADNLALLQNCGSPEGGACRLKLAPHWGGFAGRREL